MLAGWQKTSEAPLWWSSPSPSVCRTRFQHSRRFADSSATYNLVCVHHKASFKPWQRWISCVWNMETKEFISIWNHHRCLSYSSFRFIWIPMLWVCGYYKYFNHFSARTVFIRPNLTYTDVRFWRIQTVSALIMGCAHVVGVTFIK